ncbi:uncharacterized protein PV09_06243 [Verruconis gallopava]|uniref:Uncharacterized protein n=1 Tax=Verruconis gallopava TaxID=253628 RepID=A0A0D1YP24_9PEZI|nr:uncharacterized protein PV09_06243 [Verruconis gallopava]KIW02427.1 hypothetical protein PV09_06243 [Verruconis gallopava]
MTWTCRGAYARITGRVVHSDAGINWVPLPLALEWEIFDAVALGLAAAGVRVRLVCCFHGADQPFSFPPCDASRSKRLLGPALVALLRTAWWPDRPFALQPALPMPYLVQFIGTS